jgi:hypothetical protein
MAQWGNSDNANGSVIWAVAQLNKTVNTANRNSLYNNTTANAFFTGATIGQYGVDTNEMRSVRQNEFAKPAHSGWVLRTEGSGGRAGRVQHEVLVAFGSMVSTGSSDDGKYPDNAIVISAQPVPGTGSATNNAIITFSVAAHLLNNTAGNLTYQWQADSGSGFANVTNGNVYSNVDTSTLSVFANTVTNGTWVACVISSNATPYPVWSEATSITITA